MPHKVLINGDEVMGQVPVLQPTNFQYRNPAIAPKKLPSIINQCFLR